ncbi:MAG: fumarylacetoacetate hydrolase family protein, partial [Acidimicrobiales bacterium]
TMRRDGGTAAGRVEGDRVVEMAWPDVGALLASGPGWAEAARSASGPEHDLSGVDLAPVVPFPGKVLCLGLNYANHIKEMGHELPEWPTIFAKFADTLTGPNDPLVVPRESGKMDWEVELAVVVGRAARRVSLDDAPAHIAGFTVLNDVSMRDWQWRTSQFLQGKMFEASTPVGPALVTPDEVDGAADLALSCEVDGEVMQEARTSDLLFGPAQCVSYLSSIVTLRPGDIISTGTPGGVGAGRTPPVFLRPGQVMRTTVEGLGTLVNRCVADEG